MRKKTLIILVILIVLVSILGVSYASWLFTGRQKDFNTLGSKCFELTMMNESEGITLDKAYPISDEEGLSTTGYTFTIKNTCNTYAAYEVNLEDMLVEAKRLSGEYIKVSINDGKPINLKELEEKEPTIEESDKAYELTSGSLGPEEETTYTIKLWMDESTPALEETMNATFLSKVSIEAGYIPEENLENEILLNVSSLTESLNNQKEIFEITGTSTNYNLIEYSLDNLHWNRIESPSKNIVITEEFTEEGKYTIYVRDEVGNIKSIEIETTKLDKMVPEINITSTDNQESIELSIAITDEKSTNLSYAITESKEEPTEWKEYTGEVTYTVVENKDYYIWTKDGAGNVTYQIYSASTIDTKAPELTISNTLTEWGTSDRITIQATDDVIGINGISISTVADQYNWEDIENTLSYETTKEIEENGTYYISVKDAYGHITTKSIVIDKVDKVAPTVSIEIQQDMSTLNIEVQAEDQESGIESYFYSTDQIIWEERVENTYQYTELSDGKHTIYVKVKDKVGNESEISSQEVTVYREYPVKLFLENGKIENGINLSNLIYDGGFEGRSYRWTLSNSEMTSERVYEGNGALKYLPSVTSMSSQNLKKTVPTLNHQYYGSLEFNSNSSFTVNDNRFEWYYSDAGGTMVFARKTATNGEWKKLSSIQILSDETYINQVWGLRNFTVNANEASYVDNLLIMDLTESFGSGNEPEVEWVDENIPWFENTASIYEGSILSEHRNEIGISLTNEYQVEQMECSNADIEVEGDKIVITNVKGEVSCRVKTKDTIAPSSSFTIGSSTTGSNGWYKALTVQANLNDNGSGVSSAKYCTTTGSTCTPNVDASISNNTFTVTLGSNASAQKVCTQVTDVAGNTSSTICSGTYKVDTTNPTAKISASSSGSNITVSAGGSSDAHSGIASYQYSRDNSTWYTSTSTSYTFTGLADGTYTVYVKVTDRSGRVSSTVSTTVMVSTSLTLLNNGNNGITGWECKSNGDEYYTTSCTRTGNGLQVSGRSSSDSSNSYTVIYTTQKIDLSKYSTLNFTVTSNKVHVSVYLLDSLPSSVNEIGRLFEFGEQLNLVTVSSDTMTSKSVDISSKTGSYYIAFQNQGGGNSSATLQIHSVSLKP